MSEPMTVAAAAAKLEVSHSWVQKQCRRHKLGTLLTGRLRVLTPADFRKLERAVKASRKSGPGRPPKSAVSNTQVSR